jgi:hypothetical protein
VDDAAHASSDEVVASVRASGDDIELAFALICQAMLLGNGGRREAALEAALEADDLARTHAAGVFIDLASNALAVTLGRSGGEGDASRRAAATDVQRRLLDAVERKSHYLAVAILSGTVLLLVDEDPMTAYVVDHVRLRLQSPFPVLPDAVGRLGEVGAAEVRARADQLTFDDAIRLAVSALDRLIDAES